MSLLAPVPRKRWRRVLKCPGNDSPVAGVGLETRWDSSGISVEATSNRQNLSVKSSVKESKRVKVKRGHQRSDSAPCHIRLPPKLRETHSFTILPAVVGP